MKKIFVFLLLMVVSFALKAQYPIQQNLGGDSTIIYIKGAAQTVGGFINGVYTDTAAANLTRIRQYQAAQIFTTGDSAMWFRSVGATKWIRMNAGGGGSPTTDTFYWRTGGNYITDTAGYRGILGTINNKPLIFMTNNQKRLILTEDGLQNLGSTNKGFMMYDTTTGVWSYAAGGSGVYTAGNGLTLSGSAFKLGGTLSENTTITGNSNAYSLSMTGFSDLALSAGTGTNNEIDFYSSGNMIIRADEGELRFGSVSEIRALSGVLLNIVPSGASTDSILTWNATNKAVRKRQLSEVVTTPTLQQVLTAGSDVTTPVDIRFNSSEQNLIQTDDLKRIINFSDDNSIYIYNLNNGQSTLLADPDNVIIYRLLDGKSSSIIVRSDSIILNPNQGQLYIDSLRTWSGISDTTYKKPMTWDTRNGRWEYAANWYGGGGGTPGGSTKQFQYNNAGAFAGSGMLTQETNQILVTGNSDATTIPFAVEGHEDLTAPIILAAQSGVKKIALHSNGSIEMQEVTDPTAAATGYNRLYAQAGKLYTHNDDGRVAQVIQNLQLVFGAGSGADSDTTAFTTSAIYGSFYNDADTIVVTSFRAVLQGTSPDVTYKIWYNDSLNVEAGATALNTAGNQVTSTTTGTNVTSITNTKIPPGNWVWVKTSTVATKPKYFSLTVNGYRK